MSSDVGGKRSQRVDSICRRVENPCQIGDCGTISNGSTGVCGRWLGADWSTDRPASGTRGRHAGMNAPTWCARTHVTCRHAGTRATRRHAAALCDSTSGM
jgi:hypothetical protein